MNLAYIILAHKQPDQVIRLINRLDDAGNYFFIHIDKRANPEVFGQVKARFAERKNVVMLKRHVTPWGRIGCVRAMLEGIFALVEIGIKFDYAINLSGQNYPIKSNAQINQVMETNPDLSYIRHYPIPYPGHAWVEEMFLYRHYYIGRRHFEFPKVDMFTTPWLNRLWNPLARRLKVKSQIPKGFQPYYGSAYWCLNPAAVSYVYNFILQNKGFLKHFEHVLFPDELFFQTILLNSPLKEALANENLRLIDFSSKKAHPAFLGESDFERLKASPKLFARKFDLSQDAIILDKIDELIA